MAAPVSASQPTSLPRQDGWAGQHDGRPLAPPATPVKLRLESGMELDRADLDPGAHSVPAGEGLDGPDRRPELGGVQRPAGRERVIGATAVESGGARSSQPLGVRCSTLASQPATAAASSTVPSDASTMITA